MGAPQPTFRDLIAANKRNSALLMAVFCLFVVVVALVLGLGAMAYLDPGAVRHIRWTRALLLGGGAGLVALLLSLLGYFEGDRFILASSGAKRIRHKDDPELFNVVEEMAIAAGVPLPKIYLIRDDALNAFATGRDPEHAAIAITRGLREKLTRDELQGVIAHEMSHIRNYDIRLMLLLAVLVGTVTMLADAFWEVLRNSGGRDSSSSSSGNNDKPAGCLIAVVLIALAAVLSLVAPALAQLIQLAVSRQREYLADASAVELTRYPQGLANALKKIKADPADLRRANRGTAHLYIANPIKKFEKRAATAFASHPPIKERIRRLEALVH
jgi:heat shock protein HtpX